jgi:hypothetical protein
VAPAFAEACQSLVGRILPPGIPPPIEPPCAPEDALHLLDAEDIHAPSVSMARVGGYFWWCFAEDMVPPNQSLWHTLDDAISGK